jgi:hypothetical protein
MAENEIPSDLVSFLEKHIKSVEQLEILLLLHSLPQTAFAIEAIVETIRSSRYSVENRLQDLCDSKLVKRIQAAPPRYQFDPEDPAATQFIKRLGTAYNEKRVRLIEQIYSSTSRSIQSFADAFKLKKKD